jgi:hypothetical protein
MPFILTYGMLIAASLFPLFHRRSVAAEEAAGVPGAAKAAFAAGEKPVFLDSKQPCR